MAVRVIQLSVPLEGEVEGGGEVLTLQSEHGGSYNDSLEFSAGGNRLTFVSGGGPRRDAHAELHVWDATPLADDERPTRD